ncbi:MAG TPA: hypothetical protein VF472_12580 [Burkholderiaceae bacterium]
MPAASPAGESLAIAALLEEMGEPAKNISACQINYAAHHISDAQLKVGYDALIGAYINDPRYPTQQLDLGFNPATVRETIPNTDAPAPIPSFCQDRSAAHLIGEVQPIGLWFMGDPFVTLGVPPPHFPWLA